MRSQRIPLGGKGLMVIVIAFLCVGCQGSRLGAYRWGAGPEGQGTIEQQKSRATVYDPYPLNDIGPEIVGGRPRGFMNPVPEAKRNKIKPPSMQNNVWNGYGR